MKLGYMMLLVAVGAMLVIAPSAMGAGADKAEKGHGGKNAVYGKVTEVGADSFKMEVKGKKDAPKDAPAEVKTIKTTASTEVVKGEEKGAKITAGDRVAVTLTEDRTTATKIVIMPAHEKKAK